MKKYGKLAEHATEKELAQIHHMNAFQQLDASKLMEEETKDAVASSIFLTEKRDGTLKARQCTGGRKQWERMPREESASLTMLTEGIFITSVIDAKESMKVAVVDLPGALYMQIMTKMW